MELSLTIVIYPCIFTFIYSCCCWIVPFC